MSWSDPCKGCGNQRADCECGTGNVEEKPVPIQKRGQLADKFRIIREAKDLTLREVEKATGISNAYLSQLETGKIHRPSYKVIKQLCDYYGIKTDLGDMDDLTMLISTMTDTEVANLTLYAKFILNSRDQVKV